MRFASYIILSAIGLSALGLSARFALAQQDPQIPPKPDAASNSAPETISETFSYDYIDLTNASTPHAPRLQKGQRASALKTARGFEPIRFARRLGAISAISAGADGTIYISDADSGRIFSLPDRDQNGRPEQVRLVPYRFDGPSAVIELGGVLYIADKRALWTYKSGEQPVKIASLQNIDSTQRYFLYGQMPKEDDSNLTPNLTLGYTSTSGTAHILSIDTQTGRAALTAQADGTLLALTRGTGGVMWSARSHNGKLIIGRGLSADASLPEGLAAASMALAHNDALPETWPQPLRDHIFIARNNPVDVIALPTSLGAALPKAAKMFTGFQSGRTAWGMTGELHLDRRGLFVADPYNGDLWLLRPTAKHMAGKDTKGSLNAAIEKLNQVQDADEAPLKRDPLGNIHESLTEKLIEAETGIKAQLENKAAQDKASQDKTRE